MSDGYNQGERMDPKEERALGSDQAGYGPSLPERLRDSVQGDPAGPRQQFTTLASVTSLTPPSYARSAFLTVTGQRIRATFDGTLPTAAIGHRFEVGEHFTLTGRQTLLRAQFIEEAASGVLDVDYFD